MRSKRSEKCFQLFTIFYSRSILDTARHIDKFGGKFANEFSDIRRGDATSEPKRDIPRFFAKQVFGNGLARAAWDSFDFRIQENAGFAFCTQGGHLVEIRFFTDAGGAVVGNSNFICPFDKLRDLIIRQLQALCRLDSVKLHRIKHTFADELDGGLAFGGFRVGNDTHEERDWIPSRAKLGRE